MTFSTAFSKSCSVIDLNVGFLFQIMDNLCRIAQFGSINPELKASIRQSHFYAGNIAKLFKSPFAPRCKPVVILP